MATLERACSVRFTMLLFAVVVAGSGVFSASAFAAIDPIAELGAQVQKVTEALPPPVRAIAGTVVQPVRNVTGTVSAPTSDATAAAAGAADGASQAVHQVEDEVAEDSNRVGAAVARESIGAPTTPSRAEAALHEVAPVASPGTHVAPPPAAPAPAAPPPTADPSSIDATASEPTRAEPDTPSVDPETADARNSMAPASADGRARGPGQDTFEAPSVDGSIRAPFTKLVAYVWPAIALGRSTVTGLVSAWARNALRLASSSDPAAAPEDELGVAGAHAEHVPQQRPFSIRSLFGGLPRFDAAWSSGLPSGVLLSFLGVAFGTLVVFLTMLWDLGVLADIRTRRRRWIDDRRFHERGP
jgi:hypothetical protein